MATSTSSPSSISYCASKRKREWEEKLEKRESHIHRWLGFVKPSSIEEELDIVELQILSLGIGLHQSFERCLLSNLELHRSSVLRSIWSENFQKNGKKCRDGTQKTQTKQGKKVDSYSRHFALSGWCGFQTRPRPSLRFSLPWRKRSSNATKYGENGCPGTKKTNWKIEKA